MGQYHHTQDLEDTYVKELKSDVAISVSIYEESKKEFRVIVDATLNHETGFASHTTKTLDEAFEYLDEPSFKDEIKYAIQDLISKIKSK